MGFRRLKSDSNVYVHGMLQVIVLAYFDDLMVFGDPSHIAQLDEQLQAKFLIKRTGELNTEGQTLASWDAPFNGPTQEC